MRYFYLRFKTSKEPNMRERLSFAKASLLHLTAAFLITQDYLFIFLFFLPDSPERLGPFF